MPYKDPAARRENRRRYYQANKQMWSDYYQHHKAERSLYHHQYYLDNSASIKARVRCWYQADPARSMEYTRIWTARNPERSRELKRKWDLRNPEKVRQRLARWRKNNPTKVSDRNRKCKYGLAAKDYEALKLMQSGACAICGKTDNFGGNGKCLVVDHDHETDRVRGLLCNSCNRALGYFRDSVEILRKATEYLEKNGGKTCQK